MFFKKTDTKLKSTTECSKCKLYMECKNPRLSYTGNGSNGIMLLLPPVTETEDDTGIVGGDSFNMWMKNKLGDIGIVWEDCIVMNSIGCHTKAFKGIHMQFCANRVDKVVREMKPKLIISFGTDNLQLTVGRDWTRGLGDILKWRGFNIPDRRHNCWLMNTVSPREIFLQEVFFKNDKWKKARSIFDKELVLKNNSSFKIYMRTFIEDVRKAYFNMNNSLPEDPAKRSPVRALSTEESLVWLKNAYYYFKDNKEGVLCYDIETSGLKPYNKEHFVYSIGLMYDKIMGSVSFLVNEQNIPYLQALFKLRPALYGANAKFDYVWMRNKLNINADNLKTDTVLMSHLLDCRDGITSLKFNVLTRFGISYEDTVHSFLVAEGTNGLNRIKEAPVDDLLYYNALDVVYTYYTAEEQDYEWDNDPNPNRYLAKELFHRGSIALAKMELKGVKMDMDLAQKNIDFCNKKLEEIDIMIADDPVWKEWKSIYKEKTSILSDTQIIDIFMKRKKLFPKGIKRTTKYKADAEWLSKLVEQEPFVQYILDYRKYSKMANTYLKSFLYETNDDGCIRSFFTLNNVTSYRMASNSPNLQNQASRDKEQVELLKSCFIPSEGNYLTSLDYTALESYGAAALCNDPYAKKVLAEDIDVHRANASLLCSVSEEEMDILHEYDDRNNTKYYKTLRNGGKLGTFSTQYSAGANTIAGHVWTYLGDKNVHVTPTELAKDRLISRLDMKARYQRYKNECIRKKEDPMEEEEFYFELYVEQAQVFLKDYWERFRVTKEWKEETVQTFVETGRVDYPMGLHIQGIHSVTFATNAPIQGSCSCVTLYAVIKLISEIEKRGMKSFPVMVVHDDILSDVVPEELDEYLALQYHVMCDLPAKVFKWITVQLKGEAEISNVNWASKKVYKDYLDLYEKTYKDKIQ